MKELLHDDDVREEGRAEGRIAGRIEGRTEGRIEGRTEGRIEGENQFVMLISRMNAGGDTDKIAQLDEPKMLLAMRKKYGIE